MRKCPVLVSLFQHNMNIPKPSMHIYRVSQMLENPGKFEWLENWKSGDWGSPTPNGGYRSVQDGALFRESELRHMEVDDAIRLRFHLYHDGVVPFTENQSYSFWAFLLVPMDAPPWLRQEPSFSFLLTIVQGKSYIRIAVDSLPLACDLNLT